MIFGMNSPKAAADLSGNDAGQAIFDVTITEFEEKVLKASATTPILVDFWAPWCGPCKQLMPILEQLVQATGGKVRLAKVNIDENPELAQAFQVQTVPTVIAMLGGQPVTGFRGMQPQSQIQKMIDELVKNAAQMAPDAIDIPASLKAAATHMAAGELQEAQELYGDVLEQDEGNVEAYVGLVRVLIASGEVEHAKALIEQVPEKVAKAPAFEAARTALQLAENAPQGDEAVLQEKLAVNAADHQSRIDLALLLFARGQKDEAIAQLIESVRIDREWEDSKARKELLRLFDALGGADPATVQGRKSLSRILFS